MDYLDFELEMGLGIGREYPIIVDSPAGEARETMTFPFDELALESHLDKLQIALLRSGGQRRKILTQEEQSVRSFGQSLFDAVVSGEVRSRYDLSRREAAQQGKGLRIKLRIQSPKLAALPWEFMYDQREGEYICLSRNLPLVRYLELAQPTKPLQVELPLRILGMVASPQDQPPLDVQREKQRLEEAIKQLSSLGLIELTWMEGQTWRALQERLQGGPWHIFHFIGHGGFDPHTEEGQLVLPDDQGATHFMSATQLARLLADHSSLRLVLLNACESAKSAETDVFSSTAATLVRRGMPAVIAMQHEITDRAAIEFARSFYRALSRGLSIDAAVAEARKAISLAVENTVEWGTPVLYLRAPDGEIFDISATDITKAEVAVPNFDVDGELLRQLQGLYDKANSAYWLEDWEAAARYFEALSDLEPNYKDVEDKLSHARSQARWRSLYNQGQIAFERGDWVAAQIAFESLVAEAPDYKVAGQKLEEAQQRLQLERLYGEAKQLFQAEQWEAVIRIFSKISAIEPDYPDPGNLLETAKVERATQERFTKLRTLYSLALEALDAGQWENAKELLQSIQNTEPGFEETVGLLARAEFEISAQATPQSVEEAVESSRVRIELSQTDTPTVPSILTLERIRNLPVWVQVAGTLVVLSVVIGIAISLRPSSEPNEEERIAIPSLTQAPKPTDPPEPTAVLLPDLGGQEITIAVENGYLPFNYINPFTGVAEGWDYDFINLACERLNCKSIFVVSDWDTLITSVAEGQYDMAADAITITEERANIVDFSSSYVSIERRLLVRRDEERFSDIDGLVAISGLTLGAQLGTTNQEAAQQHLDAERIITFDNSNEAIQALINGDVDGVVIDAVAGEGYISARKDILKLVGGSLADLEDLGLIFPKGSDLTEAFNAVIEEFRTDGTLHQLKQKWFTDEFKLTYEDIFPTNLTGTETSP